MKLLLIFPSWCSAFGEFKKVAKKASTFPPLNLSIVAAYAEKANWEVKLIDGEVLDYTLDDILDQIKSFSPDLIGMTATSPFFKMVTKVSHAIKQNFDIPIMLGGPHPSLMREKAFLECFDYFFIDESELILPEFFEKFSSSSSTKHIKGIMQRVNGEIIFPGTIPRIQNLDEVPFPARHLLPYNKYKVGTMKGPKKYTSLQMTRGCPFKCVYCANDLYGTKVRRRSIDNVLNEIEYIVNDLKINHIYFLDDVLTLNRKFILSICDEIERRKIKITFEGSTRANLWDEALVRRLKKCGLIRISFGLESADEHVRKVILKKVPLDAYNEANRLNNKLGIETINSVMLGLPGEDRKGIQTTLDYLKKSKDIQHATYSIAMPYPGTEMLKMAERNEHGLKLVDSDPEKFHRYGAAVMEVNGIKPEEIIGLQKKGLITIYSRWWRWLPMIRRHGIKSLITPATSTIIGIAKTSLKKGFKVIRRNEETQGITTPKDKEK